MAQLTRPILLDVTRLLALSWTRRQATGLDRVARAYLEHFQHSAHAVVQHRGIVWTLGARSSDQLFQLLLAPPTQFRSALTAFVPTAVARGSSQVEGSGQTYINVGHTDFDLASHHQWTRKSTLRSAYFIHDLIPIRHPELTRPHAVKRHRGRVEMALQNADRIIVSSNHVASDLRAYAMQESLPTPPILTAPLAGAQLPQGGADLSHDEPFFLAIGTLEPRKNHRLLIDLWREIVQREGTGAPRLVLIGQTGRSSETVLSDLAQSDELRGKVELIAQCSDERMGALLRAAKALLMPSLAEGYGLPVIEALQSGTPVIASDIPIFKEIGQNIPLLLDPHDRAAWGTAIADYTNNSTERARQITALDDFAPPQWSDHFARLENWLALPEIEADDACLSA